MVTCPRCAQPVDETAYSACPHCSTPLPAPMQAGGPPQAQAPQPPPQSYTPSASPGTRVSLTGEVIEEKPAGPPISYAGAARPTGPNASRGAYSPSRSETPSRSGGGSKIVGILLGIVLIGGGIGAGWWFLVPHSNPKTVVQQFDAAFAAQDWKTVYNNMALPEAAKSKYKDADAFATDMSNSMQQARSNPISGTFLDALLKAFQSAQVGEPTIEGDTATVHVKMTISASIMGQNVNRSIDPKIPLTKVNGVWKIDGSKGGGPAAMGGLGGAIPGL